MGQHFVQPGSAGNLILVKLRSSTTGQLLPDVAFGSVVASYQRVGSATAVGITLSDGTLGTWTSGGWVETQQAGVYQFGVPDEVAASGSHEASLKFSAPGAIDASELLALDVTTSNPVAVTPLGVTSVQNKVAVRDIELIQYGTETFTWALVDADGDPVDLSGKTIRLTIFSNDGSAITGIAQYESPGALTIGGTGHNNVTRTFSTTDSGTRRTMQYVLWNQTDGIPLARGKVDVVAALRTYP